MIKKLLLFTTTVLIVAFSPVNATNKTDSLSISGTDSQYRFMAKELILPGALVAVGATSLFLNPMEKLDESITVDSTVGKGTACLLCTMDSSRGTGIISGSKPVMAMNRAGRNRLKSSVHRRSSRAKEAET